MPPTVQRLKPKANSGCLTKEVEMQDKMIELDAKERAAHDAIKTAIGALERAIELSDVALFGSMILTPLRTALDEAKYAEHVSLPESQQR